MANPTVYSVAEKLRWTPAQVRGVAQVEAMGQYSWSGGRIPALLERHWVYKWIRDNKGKQFADDLAKRFPDVINPTRGGYGSYDAQYGRVAKVCKLGFVEAAHYGTSWGAFQIMGLNHSDAGFSTAKEMADYLHNTPNREYALDVFATFLLNYKEGRCAEAMRKGDSKTFAYLYNGASYAEHDYDGRIDRAVAYYTENPSKI